MKKYLTLVLFVLIANFSFGQSNYQDVVYLKNGSIIRGVIIEQVPNKSIKIETADRNVFVYQMDEIEKMTKEPNNGKSLSTLKSTGLKSGYKGIVELGYQVGIGDFGLDRLKINIINGYQFNPYFSLGIGTGMRYYFDVDGLLIPVFADFRANFTDNKFSPYFSLGIGYSFDATYDFEGVGFLLNPTLGLSIQISDKSAINVGLGYEMQKMSYYDYYGGSNSINSGAISLNVGLSF